MSNISDDLAAGSIVGMIFGLPIFIGIAILAIPVIIVACIIDVPALVLMQNLLVFAIAVFFVWLFSKHQIIENGIVGLIAGSAIHTYFKWHPVFCILVGVAVVGILFFISNIKIGFWIKTIPFSLIVTIMNLFNYGIVPGIGYDMGNNFFHYISFGKYIYKVCNSCR